MTVTDVLDSEPPRTRSVRRWQLLVAMVLTFLAGIAIGVYAPWWAAEPKEPDRRPASSRADQEVLRVSNLSVPPLQGQLTWLRVNGTVEPVGRKPVTVLGVEPLFAFDVIDFEAKPLPLVVSELRGVSFRVRIRDCEAAKSMRSSVLNLDLVIRDAEGETRHQTVQLAAQPEVAIGFAALVARVC
jgi:hypothetical protein